MSRIYFHAEDNEAEVAGPERHMGNHLGNYLGMIEVDDWFLGHVEPKIERGRSSSLSNRPTDFELSQLRGRLLMGDEPVIVLPNGTKARVSDVLLNTALRIASDPVNLMIRLHAQCEIHTWTDGPNRAWLAGIIEDGRKANVLRGNMGWESVIELLRAKNDSPVVTSYSVTRQFPNREVANWTPPEDSKDDEDDAADQAWDELPRNERWKLAMDGLRKKDPWLELKPENFRTYHFGSGIDAFKINEVRAIEGARERKARRDAAEARGERPSIMDMD